MGVSKYPIVMQFRAAALFLLIPFSLAAAPRPAEWVPVRWPWSDAQSLDLLTGTPVNCLLVTRATPAFVAAAAARGIATLAVNFDPEIPVDGLVFEGAGAVSHRPAQLVIELLPRYKMTLGSSAPIIGTYQGVWPGIAADDGSV